MNDMALTKTGKIRAISELVCGVIALVFFMIAFLVAVFDKEADPPQFILALICLTVASIFGIINLRHYLSQEKYSPIIGDCGIICLIILMVITRALPVPHTTSNPMSTTKEILFIIFSVIFSYWLVFGVAVRGYFASMSRHDETKTA
jgi:hypothetical protein